MVTTPDPDDINDMMREMGGVIAIWVTPTSPGVTLSYSFEMIAGPKRYMRLFPDAQSVEWGWVVHDTAVRLWFNPYYADPEPTPVTADTITGTEPRTKEQP